MASEITTRSVDVLVVDDEESIREGCRQALKDRGYRAMVAKDGLQGIDMVKETKPRLVLLDQRMPYMSGMEMLQRLPTIDPRIVPIVITGYGTVDSAVMSMKLGAFDFIAKPFDMDQLLDVVGRGIAEWETKKNERHMASTKRLEMEEKAPFRDLTETDVLLKGLEVVDQYRSLGFKDQSLPRKLSALEAEARHHVDRLGEIQQEEKVIGDLVADLKMVDAVIEKHEYKRNALIQILMDIQAAKRWLPRHVLLWTGRRLGIPLSRIYAVASFYEAFSLVPQGAHTVQVCTGTACHVRDGTQLLATVSSLLGIKPGQTDATMQFTLKTVNCLGCCALAPVMVVDKVYYGNPSPKQIKAVFQELREKEMCHA
jgi:NADH-quinone oxidoreductase subunit E